MPVGPRQPHRQSHQLGHFSLPDRHGDHPSLLLFQSLSVGVTCYAAVENHASAITSGNEAQSGYVTRGTCQKEAEPGMGPGHPGTELLTSRVPLPGWGSRVFVRHLAAPRPRPGRTGLLPEGVRGKELESEAPWLCGPRSPRTSWEAGQGRPGPRPTPGPRALPAEASRPPMAASASARVGFAGGGWCGVRNYL